MSASMKSTSGEDAPDAVNEKTRPTSWIRLERASTNFGLSLCLSLTAHLPLAIFIRNQEFFSASTNAFDASNTFRVFWAPYIFFQAIGFGYFIMQSNIGMQHDFPGARYAFGSMIACTLVGYAFD